MKTDGLFTIATHPIPVRRNEEFKIVFFGDVHRDSPNHAHGAWQDFLSYARGLRNAYFFGLGDYLDALSGSERACVERIASELHETTANNLENTHQSNVELFAKEMKFAKGRIIGLLGGNHYFKFSDGTTSDQRICRELKCQYLGVSAFVRLSLTLGTATMQTLDIWAHHGTGAGRLLGGSINRIDQMREHAEADIYVMGHDHKRMVVPATPRLYLRQGGGNGQTMEIKQRQQWLVRSGSFLASYTPNQRNYNVDAGRGPCSLGHCELSITPHSVYDERKPAGARNGRVELQIRGVS